MHGNVYEWCITPCGRNDKARVTRGGSWTSASRPCMSGWRGCAVRNQKSNDTGFRVVFSMGEQESVVSERQGATVQFAGQIIGETMQVIYVADKSGSMAGGGAFRIAVGEIKRSLGTLNEAQRFNVMFFAQDGVIEYSDGLAVGSESNVGEAQAWISRIAPRGSTRALPALGRAFKLLRDAKGGQAKKVVILFSDGDFKGMGKTIDRYRGREASAAVLQWLRDYNQEGRDGKPRIRVYTVVPTAEAESKHKRVMAQIASQNGGQCYVLERTSDKKARFVQFRGGG